MFLLDQTSLLATPLKIQLVQPKWREKGRKLWTKFYIQLFNCNIKSISNLNLEHGEILTLFKTKRNEHVVNMGKIDGQYQFEATIVKWKKRY